MQTTACYSDSEENQWRVTRNILNDSVLRPLTKADSPLLSRFLTKSKSRFSLKLNHPSTITHKTEAIRRTERNTEAQTLQQSHRLLKCSKMNLWIHTRKKENLKRQLSNSLQNRWEGNFLTLRHTWICPVW